MRVLAVVFSQTSGSHWLLSAGNKPSKGVKYTWEKSIVASHMSLIDSVNIARDIC